MATYEKIYLYARFERFWHWLQALLILILLVTGLEVHGSFPLLGFETAATVHEWTGIIWLIAFAFFVFWLFTTNEWKQYIPTTRKMAQVAKYYSYGIFRGQSHPVPKRKDAKHNPLQRISYLLLTSILLPVQMVTGLLYWTYNSWEAWGLSWLSLDVVAWLHLVGAFLLFAFIIMHVYMTTTGHRWYAHLKGMITGWEEVEPQEVEDWEARPTG
jgi:formate dehydrogenase gamma subunit